MPDITDDPDFIALPEDQKQKLLALMEKMLGMGIFAVYGQEDEGVSEAAVDCSGLVSRCRAMCCTFQFALTKDEVNRGIIRHNHLRPFFIARDDDGYCPHLDRDSLRCSAWEQRPLRCRRYDCRTDPQVWGADARAKDEDRG